jgi:prepilin-type N-terminal cleavage/methylation domain-containing protein/prepilin-type processing-associated H-X9-DG protein
MRRHLCRKSGFTLVELLVVIAIIGVLVALLLPAVQTAREAARRTRCKSNLKNLGLALHNYHDTFGRLPPGAIFTYKDSYITGSSSNSWGQNWLILLLPFIEQNNLFSMYDFKELRAMDGANRNVVSVEIPLLKCPSDSFGEKYSVPVPAVFARGNYGANYGAGNGWSGQDLKNPGLVGPFNAMGFYGARFPEISDGLSSTVAVAEIITGKRAGDQRGAWADAVGSYICGTDFSSPRIPRVPNGNALDNSRWDNPCQCDAPNNDRDLRCISGGNHAFQTTRSHHPGGVQIGMADGSVIFINDTINVNTWLALLSQADGGTPLTEY